MAGARPAEPTPKNLRNSEYVGAKKEGNKTQTKYKKDQASQPFEVADSQPRGRPRSRQSNEMFSRNVGDKQRCPNRKPSHAAAGQEVIGRSALFAREVKTDGKDHDEIHDDNRDIDPGQGLVGEMRRGLDHNPPSPVAWLKAQYVPPVHRADRHDGTVARAYGKSSWHCIAAANFPQPPSYLSPVVGKRFIVYPNWQSLRLDGMLLHLPGIIHDPHSIRQ